MKDLRLMRKHGRIDDREERILRYLLQKGEGSFGTIRSETGITKPTLSSKLRRLVFELRMVKVRNNPYHQGVPIYSLNEPFPQFSDTLVNLEARAKTAEDLSTLMEHVALPSVLAMLRCFTEADKLVSTGSTRQAVDGIYSWVYFIEASIFPKLRVWARERRLRAEDIITAMEKAAPEIGELWGLKQTL